MKVMHLSEPTLRRLLQRELDPSEAKALAEHLAADCEVCEDFLAARATADAADGLVDRALFRLASVADPREQGNDLEFERIRRRIRRGGAVRFLRLGAVAAAVLAAGALTFEVARHEERVEKRSALEGVKGMASQAIPVRLRFVVVHPSETGRPPELEKGVSGAVLDPLSALQFEVEMSRPGHAALVRVGPRGDLDLFWTESFSRPGPVEVSLGGRPAAYPLAGLSGPQRVLLVASPEPLTRERVVAAARALAPPARAAAEIPALEGLSIDLVEVTVR
jgi:hypothetical protein